MGKRNKPLLDQILVIDVESTCWDGEMSVRPKGEESEIIEIGIALLDHRSGKISRQDSLLIRPSRSSVSEFCTHLTGWTEKDLSSGISFETACCHLRQHLSSKRRVFASWGNYDRRQFERQCASFNIPYPFGPSHLNVKDLFALRTSLVKHVNVMAATKILNIPFEGQWHVGGDDAFNIARILAILLRVGPDDG